MAYQGHREDSHWKLAADGENVAPADRPQYNPLEVDPSVPGHAARVNGYPRDDGEARAINAGGRIANGSATRN